MRRFSILWTVSVMCAALLGACSEGSIKPNVTGAAGELLLVVDDSVYRSVAGDSLRAMLDADVPCLPQSEPMFNVSRTTHRGFNELLKPARNILIVNVGKQYSVGKIKAATNKWAQPQAVLYANATDTDSLAALIGRKKNAIYAYFLKAERDRNIRYFTKAQELKPKQMIEELFGASMMVPRGMKRTKTGTDFLWISGNNGEFNQNILVYSVPYYSIDQFKREELLRVRDSVLKANVPGPTEGSYMTTEYQVDPPIFEKDNTEEGKYAAKLTGRWRVEGDLMGGPFVSLTVVNSERLELLTVESFVYAPNQYKRNIMRQLEAILYTLTFNYGKD
ncbi:MAG: DUF4837 family protein [Paludibacteraceae bacterium]|nr:DUF4837 family protein [Paludibacteraceae bacterium]